MGTSNIFRFSIIVAFLVATVTKAMAQNDRFDIDNSLLALASPVLSSGIGEDKTKIYPYTSPLNIDKRHSKSNKEDIHITDTPTSQSSTSVLPFELTGFRSIASHQNVFLQWKASYFQNAQQLIIEQSLDGISFQEISDIKVNPSEKTNGIILSQRDGLFYYRLKIVDNNSIEGYSETLACKTNTEASGIVSVFPNSINDEWLTALNIATAYRGKIKVVITDDHGQQLIEFHGEIISENTRMPIGVATIPKGVYSIFVSQSNGSHIGLSQELVKL